MATSDQDASASSGAGDHRWRDPASTLMHDPAELHPWDEDGPPTDGDDGLDADVVVERTEDLPTPIPEVDDDEILEIVELTPLSPSEEQRQHMMAIGLAIGVIAGLLLVVTVVAALL